MFGSLKAKGIRAWEQARHAIDIKSNSDLISFYLFMICVTGFLSFFGCQCEFVEIVTGHWLDYRRDPRVMFVVMRDLQARLMISSKGKKILCRREMTRRTCPVHVYFLLACLSARSKAISCDPSCFAWHLFSHLCFASDRTAKATRHRSNSLKRIPKVSRHMPKLTWIVASSSSAFFWVSQMHFGSRLMSLYV